MQNLIGHYHFHCTASFLVEPLAHSVPLCLFVSLFLVPPNKLMFLGLFFSRCVPFRLCGIETSCLMLITVIMMMMVIMVMNMTN